MIAIRTPKSRLRRLADRIDAPEGSRPLPKHSRVARMIKQARDIVGVDILGADRTKAARRTSAVVRMHDGKVMAFYSDGSLRHAPRRLRGKALVKAAKRARQARRLVTAAKRAVA